LIHRATLMLTLAIAVLPLASCYESAEPDPLVSPVPTYQGPAFLRGTIGSLASIDGYQPVLVSGFGLVVGLNHTGSGDCPAALREYMLREIAKGGFGRRDAGFRELGPERVLASDQTAVVVIEGVIPAGSPKGTRFDLLVSALPQTSTTSLAGGRLYSMDLRINGADLSQPQAGMLARGSGPVFVNPFAKADRESADVRTDQRIGRVLSGGQLMFNMPVALVLPRPSWRMTRTIADRINGRFPHEAQDERPLAVPLDDSRIEINVISRFRNNPQQMLDLVSHLYLNPTPQYNEEQARQLAQILTDPANHRFADDIAYAWEAMGRIILPTLRPLYDHSAPVVRMAALQAGARLDDLETTERLHAIASDPSSPFREKATVLLGEMAVSRKASAGPLVMHLRELVDADDPHVRLAAAEALAAIEHPAVQRFAFGVHGDKMLLTEIAARQPMIYIGRGSRPHIVVFGNALGFKTPLMFSHWQGTFMLRCETGDEKLSVFYKSPAGGRAMTHEIPPTVTYLAGIMAFEPTFDSESPGLNLSFGEIVEVLHALTQDDHVEAPLVLQQSDLYETIRRRRLAAEAGGRDRRDTEGEDEPVTPPDEAAPGRFVPLDLGPVVPDEAPPGRPDSGDPVAP